MKIGSSLALLAATAMLVPSIAGAHHSFAMFDRDKTVELAGTVKTLQWSNPHVWLWIVVKNKDGEAEDWGFESGPTNTLMRAGWKRDTLKPGDKVNVTTHPMKNGSHAGSLATVALEGGQPLDLGIQGAKPEEGEKLP